MTRAFLVVLAACGPSSRVSPDAAEGSNTRDANVEEMGECSPQSLGTSYIGCEYFPTVTGNVVDPAFDFAVTISNLGDEATTVTIDGGALTAPRTFDVPPNGVRVETLPWVAALKQNWAQGTLPKSALQTKGAYHLVANHPVTAYQFNPLQYEKPSGNPAFPLYSQSNDATLLIPVNAMAGDYVAASWPAYSDAAGILPSELTVTATADHTEVTVHATSATRAGTTVTAWTNGQTRTITLDRGDVLQLLTDGMGDLSGSTISANHPVQVISGHYCTFVPSNVPACDHLEEIMLPTSALGTSYLVTSPMVDSRPTGNPEVVRIIAATPNVTLTYEPPRAGAPTSLGAVGSFIELPTTADSFQIRATGKIIVAQYMVGQDAGGGTGDPSMAIAVPDDQYRTSYLFHAPLTYESNYVNITAPMGAAIMLDGTPVGELTPIGATGSGVRRVKLMAGGDGNHRITGDQPFGISVYGYGQYTSYWYPGGLNLNQIIL